MGSGASGEEAPRRRVKEEYQGNADPSAWQPPPVQAPTKAVAAVPAKTQAKKKKVAKAAGRIWECVNDTTVYDACDSWEPVNGVHTGCGAPKVESSELRCGARVREIETRWGAFTHRLHYRKIEGNGPAEGWVMIEDRQIFMKKEDVWVKYQVITGKEKLPPYQGAVPVLEDNGAGSWEVIGKLTLQQIVYGRPKTEAVNVEIELKPEGVKRVLSMVELKDGGFVEEVILKADKTVETDIRSRMQQIKDAKEREDLVQIWKVFDDMAYADMKEVYEKRGLTKAARDVYDELKGPHVSFFKEKHRREISSSTKRPKLVLASCPEVNLESLPVLEMAKWAVESAGGRNIAGDATDIFHKKLMNKKLMEYEMKGWRAAWQGKLEGVLSGSEDLIFLSLDGGAETQWERTYLQGDLLRVHDHHKIEVVCLRNLDDLVEYLKKL